ncbi:hypothetical protein [Ekhidna sp.]|uniref:hypothetical protein n=1 Tax=Ekhidna sp. TaxID=2608089 RepID=UPI003BAACBEA
MKKVLLIATLVAFFGCADAQTEKGGWLIGASTSFEYASTSYDDPTLDKTTNFNLEIVTGYFLIDNLAVGLNYGYDKEKQGFDGNTTTFIGPFVRYYVKGTFFVGTSYSAASREDIFARAPEKSSFRLLAFEAGYPIWIVDTIAIEPSLNYGIATGEDIVNSKTFGLNLGLNLYF